MIKKVFLISSFLSVITTCFSTDFVDEQKREEHPHRSVDSLAYAPPTVPNQIASYHEIVSSQNKTKPLFGKLIQGLWYLHKPFRQNSMVCEKLNAIYQQSLELEKQGLFDIKTYNNTILSFLLCLPQKLGILSMEGFGELRSTYNKEKHLSRPLKSLDLVKDIFRDDFKGIIPFIFTPKGGLAFKTILNAYLEKDDPLSLVGVMQSPQEGDDLPKHPHGGYFSISSLEYVLHDIGHLLAFYGAYDGKTWPLTKSFLKPLIKDYMTQSSKDLESLLFLFFHEFEIAPRDILMSVGNEQNHEKDKIRLQLSPQRIFSEMFGEIFLSAGSRGSLLQSALDDVLVGIKKYLKKKGTKNTLHLKDLSTLVDLEKDSYKITLNLGKKIAPFHYQMIGDMDVKIHLSNIDDPYKMIAQIEFLEETLSVSKTSEIQNTMEILKEVKLSIPSFVLTYKITYEDFAEIMGVNFAKKAQYTVQSCLQSVDKTRLKFQELSEKIQKKYEQDYSSIMPLKEWGDLYAFDREEMKNKILM